MMMVHQKSLRLVSAVLLGLCLLLFYLTKQRLHNTPIPVMTETAVAQTLQPGPPLTSCRYGVATTTSNDNPFLQTLGFSWASDFTVNFNRVYPAGIEYVPMIRMTGRDPVSGQSLPYYIIETQPLTDELGGLGPLVVAHPGRLWIVGNEVDRVYWQDDVMPQVYAQAYHDIYHFIKTRDPSARLAISGLVEVTPGRLQYLDIVWQTYLELFGTPMPVDVWNMHIYVLPEKRADGTGSRAAIALGTDPAIAVLESDGTSVQCPLDHVYCYAEHDDMGLFVEHVVAMRQWMKEHGQQNKPLLLGEFSLLYPYIPEGDGCYLQDEYGNCFTPARVSQYLLNTVGYLESATDPTLGYPLDGYRLVQQWLWYAMNDQLEGTPNKLVENDYSALTPVGVTMRDWIATRPLSVNVLPSAVSHPIAHTNSPTNTISVTLTVNLRNNGNTQVTDPFTVTFYEDETLTAPIGSVTLSTPLNGCTIQEFTASVVWQVTGVGHHPYWVKVDANQQINESNEGDNVATGSVLINPQQIYLPSLFR